MANNNYEAPDPEDMFADTRMSFGDHIEDLRTHLIRAIKGFLVGMLFSFWPLGPYVVRIIVSPVEDQLLAFKKRTLQAEYEKKSEELKNHPDRAKPMVVKVEIERNNLRAAIKAALSDDAPGARPPLKRLVEAFGGIKRDLDEVHSDKAPQQHPEEYVELTMKISDALLFTRENAKSAMDLDPPRLTTLSVMEAFLVYFKVSMLTGLVLSSPWVFFHIWAFIAAGLYPHEKKLVNVYLPFSLSLFIGGILVCQFLVMPKAIEAMLWFNEWLGMGADLRLSEWLSFALAMPLVFGLSFQTPLVMMFLHKIGLFGVDVYRDKRRIAWMVMAVFAAIITPTVDAISMLFLWVPMVGLYELGILLCVWQGEQEAALLDFGQEEKSDELVEV